MIYINKKNKGEINKILLLDMLFYVNDIIH